MAIKHNCSRNKAVVAEKLSKAISESGKSVKEMAVQAGVPPKRLARRADRLGRACPVEVSTATCVGRRGGTGRVDATG